DDSDDHGATRLRGEPLGAEPRHRGLPAGPSTREQVSSRMAAIPPISGFSPTQPITASPSVAAGDPASGAKFGSALTQGIDALQQTQATADNLATKASTGSLQDIT